MSSTRKKSIWVISVFKLTPTTTELVAQAINSLEKRESYIKEKTDLSKQTGKRYKIYLHPQGDKNPSADQYLIHDTHL